jgi:hypothetical protein
MPMPEDQVPSAFRIWGRQLRDWFRYWFVDDPVEIARVTTVQLCGFLPTVDTVTKILAVNNPSLKTGVAVAYAICAAVSRVKAAQKFVGTAPDAAPTVDGVMVEGEWVQ